MYRNICAFLMGVSGISVMAVLSAHAEALTEHQNVFAGETYSFDSANVSQKMSAMGGAVYLVGDSSNTGNLNITGNTIFKNNRAMVDGEGTGNGGAIYVGQYGVLNISDSGNVNNKNYASFSLNESEVSGGAIYNQGTVNISTSNNTFRNNAATVAGGAVYNAGQFNINGDAVFEGNNAAGTPNSIHNVGTLNIVSGTTTIKDGISGNTGSLNIASGAILDIGTTVLEQNNLTINGRLVAMLDTPESFAKLNVTNFSGNGKLTFVLNNLGQYDNVFGVNTPSDEDYIAFSDTGITLDSPIYSIIWSEDNKSLTARRKTADEIATDNELSNTAGQTLFVLVDSGEQLQDVVTEVQYQLALNNSTTAEYMLDAMNPESASVAQSTSVAMQNTVAKITANRMIGGVQGRNGGDVSLTSGGVWAQGLYNKTKQNNAFNGYTRGVAFGVDGTVNNVWTLGAGYAFAHSDISGTARDTEIDSLNVFLYGQYKPSDWYINAVLNYASSDYAETSTAPGFSVKSDYDVSSFGAVIMAGYELAAGFTPSVGLRYVHVSTDDYKNSLDIANSFSNLNYLTAVFDTKYAHRFNVSKRWTLLPEFHYGVSFDMVSDAVVATVVIPGAEFGAYTLTGNRLSRLGAEFGFGIGAKYREMDLSLNYDIEVREGYTSQTGRVKFRYNF